jgi:eukaryotic-like serine/threonine-protein kinase
MTTKPKPDDFADLSVGERAAVARMEVSLFGTSDLPTTIDRYQIQRLIGGGAFGKVYQAHDPTIDRAVAIKVLRETDIAGAPERLLREAKVMATVSHANVAAVFDAGIVGTGVDARVYIVMELVVGVNVRQWLQTTPSNERMLDVMRQAGRGLAAAHAAGVIHGDFKPENILVGDDGRVRVVDFGLAHNNDVRDAPTRKTDLIGTPAYMAPEQFRGQSASALSDQFSFGVALWEALMQQRPFIGTTVENLMIAMSQPIARPRAVSATLAAVMQRCLATDPQQRFANMAELVSALEAPPRRKRRRLVIAVATTSMVAVSIAVWQAGQSHDAADECKQSVASLATLWNSARRDALAASGAAVGNTNMPRALKLIDDYANAWQLARLDSCHAAAVRHEQSTDLTVRRNACLADRFAAFEAVVTELGASAANSLKLTQQLPSLAPCNDVANLSDIVPLPSDPVARAEVAALTDELTQARAAIIRSDFKAALTIAHRVDQRGETLNYAPLRAQAQVWISQAQTSLGDASAATLSARAAFDFALAAREQRIALFAASVLAFAGATDPRQKDESLRWVATAKSLLATVHDLDLEAKVANAEGNVYLTAGDGTKARIAFERTITLFRSIDPNHANLGSTLAMLGVVDLEAGNVAIANAELTESQQRIAHAFGEQHAENASALVNLALVKIAVGEYDEATQHIATALAIWKTSFGAGQAYDAYGYSILASAQLARGQLDAAVSSLQKAETVAIEKFGADHMMTGQIIMMQAEVAARQGKGTDAVVLAERACSNLRSSVSAQSSNVATCEATWANALRVVGKLDQAQLHAEQAIAMAETTLGKDHPQVAIPLLALSEVMTAQHRNATALLLRAEQGLVKEPLDASLLAHVRIALARSYALAGDVESAHAVAQRGLQELTSQSDAAMQREFQLLLAKSNR